MKNKTEYVAKSNRLIEASYRLTLVEQQIILLAICRAREEQRGLDSDRPVTITAADFAARYGTNEDRVYSQLKTAMAELYERSVTIHDTDPETGKPRVKTTRWISDKAYIDGAGRVQLTFASAVIPYITRLETEFTSYRLEQVGGMSSVHAVRLYELLFQYRGVGSRTLEVSWLRDTLQLDGKYTAIKDLKKWVLDVAVSQINEHSDLAVSYDQRKTGRAVTHLVFTIRSKTDAQGGPAPESPVLDRAYIERHANPGESYESAGRRLRAGVQASA